MLRRTILSLLIFAPLYASNHSTRAEQNAYEFATFGGGCYWCVEAVFQRLEGVQKVEPGFMGGRIKNPTYKQVLTGRSGHAEVVRIKYDPAVVSYQTLLQVFFRTHDPTTLNRQGPDIGTQYRSVIFCHSDEQRETATEYKRLLMGKKVFRSRIVTFIEPADTFYPTDADHVDYFNRNQNKPYCVANVVPKLEKLRKDFAGQLKPE
ncbi:Peptide methionine sulfoxide reductase MsrA [Crateriforma conspicua]|nr:Peptide methionine sulfoxide reductase MsrA [Crateriforma conspicua]